MNKHLGSTLESLFDDLGEGDEFRLRSQKKAFVLAATQRMTELHLSKNALAKRMDTSRPAVDRLLDPDNTSLTFATLNRVTCALGLDFSLQFSVARRPATTSRKPTPKRRTSPARRRSSAPST